jgi:hypothetical protein
VKERFIKLNSVSLIAGIIALKFNATAAAQTYDWTTIAGNAGYGVADGTNNAARFTWPTGIAVDRAGSVYVTDRIGNSVRKLTSVGTNWVTRTIGGLALNPGSADGTGSAAWFNYPSGVAVDSDGILYVADSRNSTIRVGTPLPLLDFLAGNSDSSIDRQTGLFYQHVVVTNVGAGTIRGLQISVANPSAVTGFWEWRANDLGGRRSTGYGQSPVRQPLLQSHPINSVILLFSAPYPTP